MTDALILKALAHRQRYNQLLSHVPQDMLSAETRVMLQWFAAYFQTYPDHEVIQTEALETLVRLRSGGADPASVEVTLHYCRMLAQPVDDEALRGVLATLTELDFAGRAAAIISEYERGGDVDVVHELEVMAREAKRSRSNGKAADWIDTSVTQILSEVENDVGIKWRRIPLLFEHIAALQGGVSVAIGARPDKGKTSMIADTLTDWAPQCVDFFGADRPILWLNNEGSGKRIIPRLYQAALGMTLPEIIELSHLGVLEHRYEEAIGADRHYIRVKDIHGASMAQIEQIIEDINPCVVVLDMIANVRMGGSKTANKADLVEQTWQYWRELQVMHDFIGIATVQVSAEGGNDLFPPYSALKDSKTGIQGATDIILLLGSLDRADMQYLRGLSTPKNKFAVAGKVSYAQGEVEFDASRCRFLSGTSAITTQPPQVTVPAANMTG